MKNSNNHKKKEVAGLLLGLMTHVYKFWLLSSCSGLTTPKHFQQKLSTISFMIYCRTVALDCVSFSLVYRINWQLSARVSNKQHRIALTSWVASLPSCGYCRNTTLFISCQLFRKIAAQPTNCAHLVAHQALKEISLKDLQAHAVSGWWAQTVRLRGLRGWSSQYLAGFLANYYEVCLGQLFGTLWSAILLTPRLDMWGKTKTRLICWIFTVYNQHHVASLHVAAGQLRRGWPFCHWKRKLSI